MCSLTELGPYYWLTLDRQPVSSGIIPFLCPQCWDDKHTPPQLSFELGAEDQILVLRLAWQAFDWLSRLPMPLPLTLVISLGKTGVWTGSLVLSLSESDDHWGIFSGGIFVKAFSGFTVRDHPHPNWRPCHSFVFHRNIMNASFL